MLGAQNKKRTFCKIRFFLQRLYRKGIRRN